MEATGIYWKPIVRHEAPGIERGERTPRPASRSWPVSWEQPGRGNARDGGSSPDNVRDGSALSDGPGPASSDEKAYERNRCSTLRKSSAGSNLTDMGWCAARDQGRFAGADQLEAGVSVRWGGHGEGLRRSHGDAVGVKVGASLIERFQVNVGTAHGRPSTGHPARLGQVRCRLVAVGGAEVP